MYTLKSFNENTEDFQTKATIWNAYTPDEPMSVEMQAYYYHTRNQKYPYQLDYILHDGVVVGFGEYGQGESFAKANKYHMEIVIHPDHKDQYAVRQFYLNHLCEQLKGRDDCHMLMTWTREDKSIDLQFIEDNGFESVMRYPVSALDVQAFDPAPFEARIQTTLASGIEIISVTQLQSECPDNWREQLYALEVAVMRDVPQPQEFVPPPFEQYLKNRIENPNFMPDGYLVARENGVCVGLTCLKRNMADKTKFVTGLTGVLRNHRRRGIAIAIKVNAIKYAKAQGIKTIETDNEEHNPMYQINVKLGFTPKPAYIDFEKSIK